MTTIHCRRCNSTEDVHDYKTLRTGAYVGPWCAYCICKPTAVPCCISCLKPECNLGKYCGIPCKQCGTKMVDDTRHGSTHGLCKDCDYAREHCQQCCDHWKMKTPSRVTAKKCMMHGYILGHP